MPVCEVSPLIVGELGGDGSGRFLRDKRPKVQREEAGWSIAAGDPTEYDVRGVGEPSQTRLIEPERKVRRVRSELAHRSVTLGDDD